MGDFFLPEMVRESIKREGALRALRNWRGYRPHELALHAEVRMARILAHELRREALSNDEVDRLAAALCVPVELLEQPVRQPPVLRIVK